MVTKNLTHGYLNCDKIVKFWYLAGMSRWENLCIPKLFFGSISFYTILILGLKVLPRCEGSCIVCSPQQHRKQKIVSHIRTLLIFCAFISLDWNHPKAGDMATTHRGYLVWHGVPNLISRCYYVRSKPMWLRHMPNVSQIFTLLQWTRYGQYGIPNDCDDPVVHQLGIWLLSILRHLHSWQVNGTCKSMHVDRKNELPKMITHSGFMCTC
jgi:hypothetical protein